MWFVYILETKNGLLYTGITTDLERRMKVHESGNGARFTRIFGFKRLVYSEEASTQPEAMQREREIKKLPRSKKIGLIKRENA